MKKLFLLLMTVMLTATCAMAQARPLHGTVVSADDDEPIIGAAVVIVSSGQGTATDLDGNFVLNTVPGTEVQVSYVGFNPAKIKLEDGMTIALKPSDNRLDELVVTGYGSTKKLGSFVGSAAVVGAAELENNPSGNVVDALQGQVAGLAIYSNTGEPSSTPSTINLRGISSLTAGTTPLFILDGAPVSSNVFSLLNPNDIESVTTLKDAASTAIYGSRAANGVIVITTKRGKMGENATVTIRGSIGWSARVNSKINMMDSYQYLEFRDRMADEMGATPMSPVERDLITKYGINTDWTKYMMKDNALTYSTEAVVRGGTESTNYYLSLGHRDMDGLIAKSGSRRETLRASFNSIIKPWLRIGFNGNLGYERYETNNVASYAGNFYINNPIVLSYMMLPYDAPNYYSFDENGNIVYGEKAIWYRYTNGGISDANFTSSLNEGHRSNVSANVSIYQQINPIKGLTLRAQQAVDAFDYRNTTKYMEQKSFTTPMGDWADFSQDTPVRGEAFQRYYQFTYTNTAEYNFMVNDKHDITVLLGQESVINKNNQFNVSTTGQPNHQQMLLTNGTKVEMSNVGQTISEYIINSYFLNADYSFEDRYFVNASVRRDGSSKFAPGHRWSTFYAFGVMWNAKAEQFLQPYTWLDNLQVRANYGTAGNSSIGSYDWQGLMGTGTTYNGAPTLGIASASNEDLTWETVKQFSAGVDFGFLNHLYGKVEFYVKDTHNMLMEVPYSYTTGFGSGMANLGSLRNTGVEVDFGAHIYRTKDWYVGVRANFAYNKNTVTELFNGREEFLMESYGMKWVVGENPFQLNTVRYAGVDQRDGKQMWYDKDGNITKVFNRDRDAVDTGKTYMAPWTGGFGADVRWKGLALRADFNWAAQKYIFNWAYQMIANPMYIYDSNQCVEMLNSWTPEHHGDMPAITETIQADSRYLENSSFVRLKNLSLSYTLPGNWLKKMCLSDLTFRFTGRNLLTFTGKSYTGYDPEYTNNGVRFSYPNTRQYEFGLEVSF